MKPTSPHTAALLQQLKAPVTFWGKITASPDYESIFAELAGAGEPAAIIDVVPFVLAGKSRIAAAAANTVHQLLRATPVKDYGWLDWTFRRRSPYSSESFYDWHKLSPLQLSMFEHFGDASVSVLGVASFHPNGYVREAAVRKLSLITTGAEVPFLILRLNDWVSNVRDAAYEAIRARIRPEYCHSFIASLALLLRLELAGRTDHKVIVGEINQLLLSDKCQAALIDSLKSPDYLIKRASFRMALNSTNSSLLQIVQLALAEHDTLIRRWAAQRVSSAFDGPTLEQLLNLMKRDRFMPVRREALRIAVERNLPAVETELQIALLDTHASMREDSRYHLRKIRQMDLANFYRRHLRAAEPQTLYSAISGLGETGTPEDDSLILPYTSAPKSKIRGAAIKALATLHRGAHVEIFIKGLNDEVPHVSRQALKGLINSISSLSAARVWELFSSASHAHVKRNALSLIENLRKWDSISLRLRALCDADEAIVDRSRLSIQRWLAQFNRSFTSPTAEQLATVRDAFDECGRLLDEKTQEHLRFSMKGYG